MSIASSIAGWTAATVIGVVGAFGVTSGQYASPEPAAAAQQDIPACTTEDDPGYCYWDAATRGNGKGRSFIHLAGDPGEVIYL